MYRTLALAFGLALSLTACDLTDVESAIDDFNIILGIESPATVIGGLVLDASTGELVEGPVSVSYASSVPGAVVDGFGDPVDGANIERGTFTFAISDASMPSAEAPVRVAMTVRAEGYLPQRRVVALADSGAYSVTVSMLSPARPPSGAGSGSGSGSAAGGSGTTTPVNASAQSDDGGSTSADVGQGTVFSDASGQPLEGDLEVEVTTVSPGTPAFASIPALEDGMAAIAAFQISATAGGQAATSAGTPVEVSVTLPVGAVDPATGQPFVPGDRVDAITFDADAGVWVPAGSGVVVAPDGATRRSGTTIKGSTSTMGSPTAYSRSNVATETITVSVERNGNTGALAVQAVTSSGTIDGQISAGQTSTTLEVSAAAERRSVGVSLNGQFYEASSPETCTNCRVSLPSASSGPVTVTITPSCSDPEKSVYADDMPSYSISAREAGGSWFGVGGSESIQRGPGGTLESLTYETTSLRRGASYDVRISYLDETEEFSTDIPESGEINESIEVPNNMCQ